MLRWVLLSKNDAIGPFDAEWEAILFRNSKPALIAAYKVVPMFEPAR